jgi:uncharacterized protein YcbX
MLNFRPNIVVRGVRRAWDEDSWGDFSVTHSNGNGSHTINLSAVKPCSRCQVPNIDPATGIESEDKQPSAAMKTFRRGKDIGLQSKEFQGEVLTCLKLGGSH